MEVRADDEKVYLTWSNGTVSKFHNIWLRDTCQCEIHYHPVTKQRLQDTFEIPQVVKIKNISIGPAAIKIKWLHDDHESTYSINWLKLHSYDPVLVKDKETKLTRTLWEGEDIAKNLPSVPFRKVMESQEGVVEWAVKTFDFGFCMVTDVPIDPKITEHLVERLSYIQHTHYGGFWDFTADLAKHDTAYTDIHLPCHTDGTYWTYTPGLQLFHLLEHKGKGGETMLADGFKAAQTLKQLDPESYELLSRIRVRAHSAGEEDVCISPTHPVSIFTHHEETGELIQVRWNNNDRSTMDNWNDPEEIPKFYKAIRLWNKILLKNQFVLKLTPGTCLIFDNWRVLHGRQAFTGSRRMCGAYVSRDDFISRVKLLSFGREKVLESL